MGNCFRLRVLIIENTQKTGVMARLPRATGTRDRMTGRYSQSRYVVSLACSASLCGLCLHGIHLQLCHRQSQRAHCDFRAFCQVWKIDETSIDRQLTDFQRRRCVLSGELLLHRLPLVYGVFLCFSNFGFGGKSDFTVAWTVYLRHRLLVGCYDDVDRLATRTECVLSVCILWRYSLAASRFLLVIGVCAAACMPVLGAYDVRGSQEAIMGQPSTGVVECVRAPCIVDIVFRALVCLRHRAAAAVRLAQATVRLSIFRKYK